VSDFSEENAMCLVAAMVAEDLAETLGIGETEALGRFLSSRTGDLLFDPSLKLWWDGPAAVAEAYLQETGVAKD
jgi:hypothetical protein